MKSEKLKVKNEKSKSLFENSKLDEVELNKFEAVRKNQGKRNHAASARSISPVGHKMNQVCSLSVSCPTIFSASV